MKLVIHIGVHKTGTSALQRFLSQNKERLRECGYWYATPRGQDSHVELAQEFLRADGAGVDAGVRHLRRLISDAEDANCHTVLVSSEVFCEHPFNFNAFCSAISDVETTLIAYLRRSDEIIISAYNQVVRDENVRWPKSINEQLTYDPTYQDIIGKFLGDKPWNLIIAPYDPKQWHLGSLYFDFLNMLGISHEGFILESDQSSENPSLPLPLLELLRRGNCRALPVDTHKVLIELMYEAMRARPDLYKSHDVLDIDQRTALCRLFQEKIHIYRPYFRSNMNESFLLPSAVLL